MNANGDQGFSAARPGFTPDRAPGETPPPAGRNDVFSAKEKLLAWVSAFLGYLFCRTFWVWKKPAVGLLFTICLFAFAFIFFGKEKRKLRSLFYPVSALTVSSALFFSSSPVLLFFAFAYTCLSFFMFCRTGSEGSVETSAGRLYLFEMIGAFFVDPFRRFSSMIRAIGSDRGGKKIGKTLLLVLAGLGIALIPTLIVMKLLSFDEGFTGILDDIRENVFEKLFGHLGSLLCGVPAGMMIFSAAYSAAHPAADGFCRENCENTAEAMKIAPPVVGAVAVVPLLFLYTVFIIAQRDYYLAVLSGTLPPAFSFSGFARDGFFRLCGVAAINAILLVMLRIFTKRTAGGRISPVVKTVSVVLSLITVVISGTAISQMVMYVSEYGLTRLRLYTLWFMALLVILFVITVFGQILPGFRTAPALIAAFVICFAALAVPDTDAVIARHNYDCYVSGKTSQIDVGYLGRLAPSSVPVLCEIASDERIDESVRSQARIEIKRYRTDTKRGFTLPSILADSALKEYGG